MPVLAVLSRVQFAYFHKTTSVMSSILFKICFWMLRFCKELLQFYTQKLLVFEETSLGKYTLVMLIWCFKHVKDFTLKFLVQRKLLFSKIIFKIVLYIEYLLLPFHLDLLTRLLTRDWITMDFNMMLIFFSIL